MKLTVKLTEPRLRIKSETNNKTQPSLLKTNKEGRKISENSRAKSCSSTGKSKRGQSVTDIRAFLAKKKLEREQKVLLGNNLGSPQVLSSSDQTRGSFTTNNIARSLAGTASQNGSLNFK